MTHMVRDELFDLSDTLNVLNTLMESLKEAGSAIYLSFENIEVFDDDGRRLGTIVQDDRAFTFLPEGWEW